MHLSLNGWKLLFKTREFWQVWTWSANTELYLLTINYLAV